MASLGNDRVTYLPIPAGFPFGEQLCFWRLMHPGIYSSVLPNPNITWEVSKKLDFGLNANLWKRIA